MTSTYSIEVRKIITQNTNKRIGKRNYIILNPNEHTLLYNNWTYEHKEKESEGPKITDIKQFVFEEFQIKINRKNICRCCISFWVKRKENPNQLTILNCDDNTFLKDTEFKESNNIPVFLSFEEKCTCKNLSIYVELLKNKLKEQKTANLIEELTNKLEKQNEDKKKEEEQKKQFEEENKKLLLKIKELEEKMCSQSTNDGEKGEKKEKKKKKIKKATNQFLKELPNTINLYYTTNSQLMISNFIKDISEFFESKISFKEINKELIVKMAEEEQFALNIKNVLENKINSIEQKEISGAINHFNVLLIGRSGVGKSTLLNKVLQEKLAETKDFDNCTQDFKSYESQKVNGLRLWDSRGSEEEYNINKVFQDVKKLIELLINEKNPDKYIHSIWYCIKGISGERFNKEIQEIVKNCYELYSIQNLPVIIVLTNSFFIDESDKFMEYIKENIKNYSTLEKQSIIKCANVLAEKKEIKTFDGPSIIPSHGIYKLMTKTFKSIKKGMKSSFTESLTQQGKKFLKEELERIIDETKTKYYKENLEDAPTLFDNNSKSNNLNYNDMNKLSLSQTNLSQNRKREEDNINDTFDTPDTNEDTTSPNEMFDIKNIKLDKVKYNNSNFINNMKNLCEELSRKLLHKSELSNKQTFLKIFSLIEKNVINNIRDYYNNIFENKSREIVESLTETFKNSLNKICKDNEIKKAKKIFEFNELLEFGKSTVKYCFKEIIESKIYEEFEKKIFDGFAEEIKNHLLEYFNEEIVKDKNISKIFDKQGKENLKECFKRIKNSIEKKLEKDNYEDIMLNKLINNQNNINNMPMNNNQMSNIQMNNMQNNNKNNYNVPIDSDSDNSDNN